MAVTSEHPTRGRRIRDLRALLGMNQTRLGKLAGVSQPTLSDVELGKAPLDDVTLENISEATGFPVSFFEVDSVDVEEGSLRFRKTSRAKRGETKQLAQLAYEICRACNDLAVKYRLAPPTLPTVGEVGDVDEIEELAVQVRVQLGLSVTDPVPHVTRSLERAHILVSPLQPITGDTPNADELGHSGVSLWRTPWELPLIGYLPNQPGDRLRFTVAHELGHLLLHPGHRGGMSSRQAEDQANRFAGAFLLPAQRAREIFTATGLLTLDNLRALKAGWGMAIQALIMRARQLGAIGDERQRSLYKQISSRGWRKNEPVTVHPEHPQLIQRLLTATYGDPIDWQAAREQLGLPDDVLCRLTDEPESVS